MKLLIFIVITVIIIKVTLGSILRYHEDKREVVQDGFDMGRLYFIFYLVIRFGNNNDY